MIQGSFCSKFNALSYDIYLVFLCLLFYFFRWASKILPENISSEKMVSDFQMLLADRPDQVLLFCFFTSFKSYDFF